MTSGHDTQGGVPGPAPASVGRSRRENTRGGKPPDKVLVQCPSVGCGARVNYPLKRFEKIHEEIPRCPRCKADIKAALLVAMGPVLVTDRDFTRYVLGSRMPAHVSIFDPTDPRIDFMFEHLAHLFKRFGGRVFFALVDTRRALATVSRFRVRTLPTTLIFRGGLLIDDLPALQPPGFVAAKLERLLDREAPATP